MNSLADAPPKDTADPPDYAPELLRLSQTLHEEGLNQDALILAEHLNGLQPGDVEVLRHLIRLLGALGRPLETLARLAELRALSIDREALLSDLKAQLPAIVEEYQRCVSEERYETAEVYAAGMAQMLPGNATAINLAMHCNQVLGRFSQAARYAQLLLAIEPDNVRAQTLIIEDRRQRGVPGGESQDYYKVAVSPSAKDNPLIQLYHAYAAANLLLLGDWTEEAIERAQEMRKIVSSVAVPSESEMWGKHLRLVMEAADPSLVVNFPPAETGRSPLIFASSAGEPLTLADVGVLASDLQAEVVFFVAADRVYVERFGNLFARFVLRYAGVCRLVVIHVIGGRDELADTAKAVGIKDPRLVFAADGFDASAVTTQCWSAPDGLFEKPVAHYQSARFQRLEEILDALKLPVFVSDIDCLLQRDVRELIDRMQEADVALNKNEETRQLGAQLTANLLLVKPTPYGMQFTRFLRHFLDCALARPEVSRWIDQVGLVMAWRHLCATAPEAQIRFFDPWSDINNIILYEYQANPFCFLSLYQGTFDMSSLENHEADECCS
jgi:tetratricopeptide (TPR) repeat protein